MSKVIARIVEKLKTTPLGFTWQHAGKDVAHHAEALTLSDMLVDQAILRDGPLSAVQLAAVIEGIDMALVDVAKIAVSVLGMDCEPAVTDPVEDADDGLKPLKEAFDALYGDKGGATYYGPDLSPMVMTGTVADPEAERYGETGLVTHLDAPADVIAADLGPQTPEPDWRYREIVAAENERREYASLQSQRGSHGLDDEQSKRFVELQHKFDPPTMIVDGVGI